jgi:hypothetical protein
LCRGYDWHGPSTLNIFKSLEGLRTIQDLLPPHFECIDGGDWINGKNGLNAYMPKVKLTECAFLVSTPHETKRTLKPEDHKEWVIGNMDRLIVMGKIYNMILVFSIYPLTNLNEKRS